MAGEVTVSGHWCLQFFTDDEVLIDVEIPGEVIAGFVGACGNGRDEPREEAHADVSVNALVQSRNKVQRIDMAKLLSSRMMEILAEKMLPEVSELDAMGRRKAA